NLRAGIFGASPANVMNIEYVLPFMQTNYRELKIWTMAFENTVAIYDVIAKLPQCESRNIADQMRRTCTAVPLNIAEGASSQTARQFLSHLRYAYASGQELNVLLMLCFRLKYIDEVMFNEKYAALDSCLRAIYKFALNLELKEGLRKLPFPAE
ncbi:four helix bundle protein, partial [Candidatus Woesearchaeota archaeon]|nr:four helix bundle protein [Candidatus Woesearchaeota archaeon]